MPIKRMNAKAAGERAVLNDEIEALQVRLIGADGSQVGIVPREEALTEAARK